MELEKIEKLLDNNSSANNLLALKLLQSQLHWDFDKAIHWMVKYFIEHLVFTISYDLLFGDLGLVITLNYTTEHQMYLGTYLFVEMEYEIKKNKETIASLKCEKTDYVHETDSDFEPTRRYALNDLELIVDLFIKHLKSSLNEE